MIVGMLRLWRILLAASSVALLGCAGSASSSTEVADSQVVLRGDGLVVATLGEDVSTAIPALTAALGEPTKDSGWYDEQIGCDIGEKLRDLFWPGLTVQFSNGPSALGAKGKEHMLAYFYGQAEEGQTAVPLRTDQGITLGDTNAALKKAYPAVKIQASEIEGPVFYVDGDVNGNVSSLDDAGIVQYIRAGEICID
jgi:hypothetical protein